MHISVRMAAYSDRIFNPHGRIFILHDRMENRITAFLIRMAAFLFRMTAYSDRICGRMVKPHGKTAWAF